jgi:hypothetical protein
MAGVDELLEMPARRRPRHAEQLDRLGHRHPTGPVDVLDETLGAAGGAARIRVEIGSATNVETLERTNRRGEPDHLVGIEIEASDQVHESASGDAAWGRPQVVRDRRPP